jgi:L-lactate dehydrogenase complex protein LldG
LVDYLQDALEAVQQKYSRDFPSAVTVITGPSRTADIEKTLVLGAHGPKELVIFVEQK